MLLCLLASAIARSRITQLIVLMLNMFFYRINTNFYHQFQDIHTLIRPLDLAGELEPNNLYELVE